MPEVLKHRTVRAYARVSGAKTFVETGTYLGEMVKASVKRFERIYSIELDPQLAKTATERFARFDTVCILQGDSSEALSSVLLEVSGQCVFWLDAHYSGPGTARGLKDSPVARELAAILSLPRRDDVILIDDARCFVGAQGYPTIAEIRDIVSSSQRGYEVSERFDIIRIHKPTLVSRPSVIR